MPTDAALNARTAAAAAQGGLSGLLGGAHEGDRGWLAWLRAALAGALATRPDAAPPDTMAEERPWLVPAAIPFIEARLRPGMAALEWGAGRSTLWLARLGLSVVSIEARADWVDEAQERIAAAGLAGLVRFVPVAAARGASLANAVAAVAENFAPHSFDLVLVDGHFRAACLRPACAALKPRGHLVLDDSHAADVAAMADHLAPWRLAAFDNGIWQTTVFQAPDRGLPGPQGAAA
jgi:hypothetical protein